jgi:hypothetical protein
MHDVRGVMSDQEWSLKYSSPYSTVIYQDPRRLDVDKIIDVLGLVNEQRLRQHSGTDTFRSYILNSEFSRTLNALSLFSGTGGIRTITDCLELIIIGDICCWDIRFNKDDPWTVKTDGMFARIMTFKDYEDFNKYKANGTLKKARVISGLIHEILTAVALGDDHLQKSSTRSLLVTNLTMLTKENYKDVAFFGFHFLPYSRPGLIEIPFLQNVANLVQKDLKVSLEDFEASLCNKSGLSCKVPLAPSLIKTSTSSTQPELKDMNPPHKPTVRISAPLPAPAGGTDIDTKQAKRDAQKRYKTSQFQNRMPVEKVANSAVGELLRGTRD